MTPKKKSEELVNEFIDFGYTKAVKCANTSVDVIINTFTLSSGDYNEDHPLMHPYNFSSYWAEVKEELTKASQEVEIDKEILEDIFVTAIEGGSNYWYYIPQSTVLSVRSVVSKEKERCLSVAIFKAMYDFDVDIVINDIENPNEILGVISKKTLQRRLQSLLKDAEYRYALEEEMKEQGDADTSDIIFQYLTMGEVVFS